MYPQIQPAIIAMITFQNEVLICHRRQNIYTHISGFIEPVETADQAVYREIKEELNISKNEIEQIEHLNITQPWPGRYCSLMIPYIVRLKAKLEFRKS